MKSKIKEISNQNDYLQKIVRMIFKAKRTAAEEDPQELGQTLDGTESRGSKINPKQTILDSLNWDHRSKEFTRESQADRNELAMSIVEEALLLHFTRSVGPILKKPLIDLVLVNNRVYSQNMFRVRRLR